MMKMIQPLRDEKREEIKQIRQKFNMSPCMKPDEECMVVLFFQNSCLKYFFKYNFGEVHMHTSTETPRHCEPPDALLCEGHSPPMKYSCKKEGKGEKNRT